MLFSDLGLIAPILKALDLEGYQQPTPIQQQAIPALLEGKDLLGCAQTGTGKTAAFAIPILQKLHATRLQQARPTVQALILTPTRELAIQIQESFENYGKFTGLVSTVIFGGVSQQKQVESLRRGVDILVATPGRLLDLLQQRLLSLKDVKYFVLDEADRMLDMGFIHDVKRVLTQIPTQRQSLFFSATMAPEIKKLADAILKNPTYVEVTPVSSSAVTIDQYIYFVEKTHKLRLLVHLVKQEAIQQSLVFTRTKHGADKVTKDLIKSGIAAAAIHGNKSQNARQRALQDFKDGAIRVLVATDIAARGIDFELLTHVINFDLPNIPETYVHRIGRTGRAGAPGTAFSFCNTEERAYLKDIQKTLKRTIPVKEGHPFAGIPDTVPEKVQKQTSQASNGAGNRNTRTVSKTFSRSGGNGGAAKDQTRAGSNTGAGNRKNRNSNDKGYNSRSAKSSSGENFNGIRLTLEANEALAAKANSRPMIVLKKSSVAG